MKIPTRHIVLLEIKEKSIVTVDEIVSGLTTIWEAKQILRSGNDKIILGITLEKSGKGIYGELILQNFQAIGYLLQISKCQSFKLEASRIMSSFRSIGNVTHDEALNYLVKSVLQITKICKGKLEL